MGSSVLSISTVLSFMLCLLLLLSFLLYTVLVLDKVLLVSSTLLLLLLDWVSRVICFETSLDLEISSLLLIIFFSFEVFELFTLLFKDSLFIVVFKTLVLLFNFSSIIFSISLSESSELSLISLSSS